MSSKTAAAWVVLIFGVCIWGVLFYQMINAAEPQRARVVESDEWFAVEHESGAVWVFRKDALDGFLFTASGELRNQIMLRGGRTIHTKENLGREFKSMFGISDEDIKPVDSP